MPEYRAKKNVAILAACQALIFSIQSLLISIGALVGFALAEDKAWATLPVAATVLGTAVSTIPASLLMGRVGRRVGFMFGAALGVVGASMATYAVYVGSFWLVCGGTMLLGMASGFAQYYRFAAADVAAESFKNRAISLVMAGGVVAGFIGPQVARLSKDVVPGVTFMGSYGTVIGLALLAFFALMLLDIPAPGRYRSQGKQRSIFEIMARPRFVVAIVNGMVGYGIMGLIMTATPLAMTLGKFEFGDTAVVIQWHVVAMFGPSFFTGSLINRFGVLNIMLIGAGLMAGSLTTLLSGSEFLDFWLALVLLGLGWNFMFVGGTTLLTHAYRLGEQAKSQAANDFLVFVMVATASLFSGQLLYRFGWETVNFAAIPFLAIAAMATLWLLVTNRGSRVLNGAD